MVKLTIDLIARGKSGYTKKKRDESMEHYIKRLTHLYLEDKNIDDIGEDLALCRNLIVLYLYDNALTKVPNLTPNGNLTHLYLQNNNLQKLDHLCGLRKLIKLYVGGNCITVLEGLENLYQLQEMHIENQKLPPGEKLLFDPRTIRSLSNNLQVLNISGNHVDTIRDLEPLQQMCQFLAVDNSLTDLKEIGHCLNAWRNLWRLELQGNPLCHKSKYRDRIIIMSPSLELLDEKEVTDTAKEFLKNWQARKEALRKRREQLTRQNTESEIFTESHNGDVSSIPGEYERKPAYVIPALQKKQFQDVLARSLSQSNSTLTNGKLLTHTRTYPDITGPRYLNSFGTVYHNHNQTGSFQKQPTLIRLGDDYMHAGDTKGFPAKK